MFNAARGMVFKNNNKETCMIEFWFCFIVAISHVICKNESKKKNDYNNIGNGANTSRIIKMT